MDTVLGVSEYVRSVVDDLRVEVALLAVASNLARWTPNRVDEVRLPWCESLRTSA
ncbi:MAG: hypothetical protein NTZ61_00085 [Proteobacteria bacterium]|nr:hypothetical protein [Pseudomonadota bacterium]